MGKALADLLQSKKALTAIATVGAGLLGHLGLEHDDRRYLCRFYRH